MIDSIAITLAGIRKSLLCVLAREYNRGRRQARQGQARGTRAYQSCSLSDNKHSPTNDFAKVFHVLLSLPPSIPAMVNRHIPLPLNTLNLTCHAMPCPHPLILCLSPAPCLVHLAPQIVHRPPSFLQDQHIPFHSQDTMLVEPQILAPGIAHNTLADIQGSNAYRYT
jgi:hypothetical protein